MRTITKFGGLVRYPYRSEGRTVTRNYNRDQYGLCTIPKVVLLRRCAYEGPVRILDHYDKYMIRTVTKSLPVQNCGQLPQYKPVRNFGSVERGSGLHKSSTFKGSSLTMFFKNLS